MHLITAKGGYWSAVVSRLYGVLYGRLNGRKI